MSGSREGWRNLMRPHVAAFQPLRLSGSADLCTGTRCLAAAQRPSERVRRRPVVLRGDVLVPRRLRRGVGAKSIG